MPLMTSLFLTLLAPVLVLWIGACVFYVLDQLVQPQDAGVAEAIVLLMAIGALVWIAVVPTGNALQSELAFGEALGAAGWPGTPPTLRLERPTLVLALILLATATVASLASLAESGLQPLRRELSTQTLDQRVAGRAARLAALGAALLFLFAGDWATMALAWIVGDLLALYTRQAVSPREDDRASETSWTVVLSLSGAICLGLVVVLQPEGGETPNLLATALALAAVVLRLLPFPLPSWLLPFAPRHTMLARVSSFLVPTLLGAHLCSQVVPWIWHAEWSAGGGQWLGTIRGTGLAVWAAVALLVSAFRVWSARTPDALIACTMHYGTAMLLLACALGLPAFGLLVVGTGVVLSVSALKVSWTQCPYLDPADPRSWWRVAPSAVALLSLAGAPLTLGFPARAAIYAQLLTKGRWLVLPLLIVAEASVLGALLRVLLDVECVLVDKETADTPQPRLGETYARPWQRELAFGAGAVLALGLLLLGMAPTLLGAPSRGWDLIDVPTGAALLLPIVGAVLLYRDQERITAWMEAWSPMVERLLDLRWLYRGIERVAEVVGAIIWNAGLMIEGAGYMAWITLVGLVILLLVLAQS